MHDCNIIKTLSGTMTHSQMKGMDVLMANASVYHWAWYFKPDKCPKKHVIAPACQKWQYYRQMLELT